MSETRQSLYLKIAQDVRESIHARRLVPGDGLPTENEFAKRYATSRVTVRKALELLCNEKIIFSHQGKGYFIRKPDYNLYTMTFDLIKPEHEVKYCRLTIIDAPTEIGAALSLPEGSPVIFLRLLLLADKEPVACEEKYIPYLKGVPNAESLLHYADYPEHVDRKLPKYALQCELRISPARADPSHAALLRRPADEPVILVERRIWNQSGGAMGYTRAYLLDTYGPITAKSGYSVPTPRTPARPATEDGPASP